MVAPSANLSGHVSPTTAAHVQSDLAGRIDLIVDGGPVAVGVESTIVGCFEAPMLLRPGGLPREEIERVLGRALLRAARRCRQRQRPAAGAGHAGLALRAAHAGAAQCRQRSSPARRCWRSGPLTMPGVDGAAAVMNLSPRSNLDEAAANLFGYLRALDLSGARAIAVMPVPHHGLGEAINDRLRRAAVGRD